MIGMEKPTLGKSAHFYFILTFLCPKKNTNQGIAISMGPHIWAFVSIGNRKITKGKSKPDFFLPHPL